MAGDLQCTVAHAREVPPLRTQSLGAAGIRLCLSVARAHRRGPKHKQINQKPKQRRVRACLTARAGRAPAGYMFDAASLERCSAGPRMV